MPRVPIRKSEIEVSGVELLFLACWRHNLTLCYLFRHSVGLTDVVAESILIGRDRQLCTAENALCFSAQGGGSRVSEIILNLTQ